MVHTTSQETTATDDDQNSKHNPYVARRDSSFWPHFHWKFPRFFSEELRWLATYVVLSRPPSLAQLISVGMPHDLRDIIQGGPPEGILSRFNDMFKEKEDATHIRAAEVMRELGWDATY